ncbi:DNA-binding response regulator [Marinicella sp. S1101]|uniref:response regulator transcription factor n=1 Tax=Marinicella marina TaxID=2996016 RepID=UPI002260AC98|nr:DNA-binding response regulator [Marinicella marina]MCX7553678.1 DNA-binding response regulator [Marinicella marina]MDJ1140768.1 DNA-binding response regulator [Marinicella marina]
MTSTNPIILAVDDNTDSLNLLNTALSAEGYTVLVASSGQQAIDVLQKATPNLVLLDAMMPEMDGFTACKIIKQQHPDIPVIFMTGLSETEHVVNGLGLGAVDYLVKPLNHTELVARVKVHISNAEINNNTKAALDSTGQHLAAINQQGDVIWTTEKAQALVAGFNSKVKSHLLSWLAQAETDQQLQVQQGQNTLVISYIHAQNDGSHLIRIKAQNLKLLTQTLKLKLKITRREADVLYWVAQAKTDWEIAQILGISERTVNKHLEQVYRKLNVNNRTAASGLALQAIN